jgi:hypothetical protein
MKRICLLAAAPVLIATPAYADLSGYEVVTKETAVDTTPSKQLIVECPKGKRATGGGWAALDSTSAIISGKATTNQPAFDGSHWLVNVTNESAYSPAWKLKAWAICVKLGRTAR